MISKSNFSAAISKTYNAISTIKKTTESYIIQVQKFGFITSGYAQGHY